MSFIQIDHLTFSYSDSLQPVFSDLCLRLDSDWKLGITGKNGTGKTTFLKLICGELKGDGKITARLPFLRFPYEISDPAKYGYEIAEKIAPDAQFWQVQRELSLIGLPEEILYRPFSTLSGGERTKFLLAVLFAGEGIPLLDEPTDHLDHDGRKTLCNYLSGKKGYFVVSHDRTFLDGCCDHILSLNATGAELIGGNYSVWRTEHDKAENAERTAKEKLEKERARLTLAERRISDWANNAEKEKYGNPGQAAAIDRGYLGAKAAKLQKRAVTIKNRKAIAKNEINERLKCFEETEELKLFPKHFYKDELLRLRNLSVTLGEKTILTEFDFALRTGERVSLAGKNGTGKSTLIKLIAGEIAHFKGERAISPRLKISYVPQLAEYCGCLADFAKERGIDESYLKAILAKFGFQPRDFARDMRSFSEGQKKKAALARSLCKRAHLYLWDEPLNYLDVPSREQLERAILSSDATMLFVEHDETFVNNIATRIVRLS